MAAVAVDLLRRQPQPEAAVAVVAAGPRRVSFFLLRRCRIFSIVSRALVVRVGFRLRQVVPDPFPMFAFFQKLQVL